jgi:hypothetical protein
MIVPVLHAAHPETGLAVRLLPRVWLLIRPSGRLFRMSVWGKVAAGYVVCVVHTVKRALLYGERAVGREWTKPRAVVLGGFETTFSSGREVWKRFEPIGMFRRSLGQLTVPEPRQCPDGPKSPEIRKFPDDHSLIWHLTPISSRIIFESELASVTFR